MCVCVCECVWRKRDWESIYYMYYCMVFFKCVMLYNVYIS